MAHTKHDDELMAYAISQSATPQKAWNAAWEWAENESEKVHPHASISTWLYVGRAGLAYRAEMLRNAAAYLINLADALEGR